jgi:hypothetical protein
MEITSPGAIFISLYCELDADALAAAGGEVTAGPINWALPVTLPKLNIPAPMRRQRISTLDRFFINSPQSMLPANYFL